ncbi:MAG: 2OG-Fe(II) oxygenase [bacterium]|nr:hypothetical protein [Deltaproteobacteria bacterium]MCP4907363.1 2OG-Fe(II) oxygenase [bacterium]
MTSNVYDSAPRASIDLDPYPHIVIENVIPEVDYKALEETFPTVEYIAGREEITNNRSLLADSDRVLADPKTPEPWRAFFEAHTQRSLFESAIKLWGEQIEKHHPGLEANFGKRLENFTTARRSGKEKCEANRRADIMLDCQFGSNAPVTAMSSTRGPHLDSGAKLFSSLVYFRTEDDDSTGGEYELLRLKKGPFPRSKMKYIPEKYIESVKRIPYRRNTLLAWLNTRHSLHGVTPRSVTSIPRRYVAISGECFTGARPFEFFSHYDEWDRPIERLRAKLKI